MDENTARERLLQILNNPDSPRGELADLLSQDPSLRQILDEMLDERAEAAEAWADEEPDDYDVWAVGAEVVLRRHDHDYLARHLLLSRSGEGSSPTEALEDLFDVCKTYVSFIYAESRDDTTRWKELEPVFRMIKAKGGQEGWAQDLLSTLNTWLDSQGYAAIEIKEVGGVRRSLLDICREVTATPLRQVAVAAALLIMAVGISLSPLARHFGGPGESTFRGGGVARHSLGVYIVPVSKINDTTVELVGTRFAAVLRAAFKRDLKTTEVVRRRTRSDRINAYLRLRKEIAAGKQPDDSLVRSINRESDTYLLLVYLKPIDNDRCEITADSISSAGTTIVARVIVRTLSSITVESDLTRVGIARKVVDTLKRKPPAVD